MRGEAGCTRTLRTGFVLPVVLGLIVIAALIAAHAVTDLGTQAALSTMRLLHQRAFEASESGIAAVMEQLESGRNPPATQAFSSAQLPTDRADVAFRHVVSLALPSGYSAGRVLESHDEIRSEGQSARDSRVVIVQGVRRLSGETRP